MSEDQIDTALSAINHPIRRSIVCYLAESGPQSYTSLLEKFKLQTGTLNHHLMMLKAILEQDDGGRYSLNRNGRIAHQLLIYAETSFAKPELPTVKRRMIVPALRDSAFGFYKLLFHPAKAFVEAQERLGPYTVCGAIVMALFFVSTPLLSTYTIARSLAGLLSVLLFSFAFVRLAYNKNPRLLRLTVSVSVSYLPAIMLNFLTILFAMFEFTPWAPLPFIVFEDPGYVALMQIFAAVFIWRFILLFFALRESCKLTASQSFAAVFASSIIENTMAFLVDYLSRMPIKFP